MNQCLLDQSFYSLVETKYLKSSKTLDCYKYLLYYKITVFPLYIYPLLMTISIRHGECIFIPY